MRRSHEGGIMKKSHGGGIMEEESWRMYPGGGIMEEVSWRRHHEEERWHPGTQEAPRRHPGGTQVDPGGTQEAPRRHPGGQGHLGDRMCVFICACAALPLWSALACSGLKVCSICIPS